MPRQLLARARLHARPLSAVLRGREHRRLRGGAVGRAVLGRLRPLRRDGRRAGARDAARHVAPRHRTKIGRRPGPAAALPRFGRRVRRDHVGDGAGASGAAGARLRGLAVRVVHRGRRGTARAGPGRPDAHRGAAVRRGRDGDQSGRPDRRAPSRTGGCLAITGYEGEPRPRSRPGATRSPRCLPAPAAKALGAEPGEAWRTGRYRGPYLRDPLLDAGVLVETLETVTFWSNLDTAASAAVTDALTECADRRRARPRW